MRLKFERLAFGIAALMVTGLAQASPIVYDVNLSDLGISEGSVTGTIETDGTIGTLGSSDILSYSLLLNNGIGDTAVVNQINSVVTISGTATTATAGLLQFNFDTPDDGGLGYFEIVNSNNGWGLLFAVPPNQPLAIVENPYGASSAGLLAIGRNLSRLALPLRPSRPLCCF